MINFQKWLYGGEISFSTFYYNGHGCVDLEKEIILRNYNKLRIKGTNIFSVEDDDTIYYILVCESRKFENFLAFTNDNPENEDSIKCTRIIVEYGHWREQNICTHQVRSVKKILPNLYKVKTNHVYYMLKV